MYNESHEKIAWKDYLKNTSAMKKSYSGSLLTNTEVNFKTSDVKNMSSLVNIILS